MSPTAVPTCFKADAAAEASQANGSPEEVAALQILVAGPGSMLINGVFGECYKKKSEILCPVFWRGGDLCFEGGHNGVLV